MKMIEPAGGEHADEGLVRGAPARAIPALKVAISRSIAAVDLCFSGPVTTIFCAMRDMGFSPGMQNMVPTRSMSA